MANYCDSDDLDQYLGAITTASGLDKNTFINNAADKMHTEAAGLYKVPFEILSSIDGVTSGVTSNILKTWNAELATGYLILAATITQENLDVHQYGKMLIDGVVDKLDKMKEQKIVLVGLTIDTSPADDLAKPKKVLSSSPDGKSAALDEESFFNRPYRQVGDKSNEVDGGPDL